MDVSVTISTDDGANFIFFVFRSKHQSIPEIADALRRDGFVAGTRIDTGKAGVGYRREKRRSAMVLGKQSLAFIQELNFELLPPEPVG